MMTILRETKDDERYESSCGRFVVAREYGKTPNGNPINGRWVYRTDGHYVDHNQYRNDLAEQHHLELES